MESSFIEELLKREVDEKAVSALVGSLESGRLVSSTSTSPNTTAGKAASSVTLGNTGHSLPGGKPEPIKSGTSPILVANRTSSSNGSVHSGAASSASISSPNFRSNMNNRSPTPNRLSIGVSSSGNSPSPVPVGTQVNIAPKGMITNAVPIAPRMPATTIMLTPDQIQLIMAQRMRGATIVPGGLVTRITGGNPVTLVPRMANHNNIPVNMVPGQVTAMPNIAPRLTVAGNQVNLTAMKAPGQVTPPNSMISQVKQEPRTSVKLESSPRPTITMQPALSATQVSAMPATTLTQVKGSASAVPGAVTYRFRQVAPSTSGSVPANAAMSNSVSVNMMKESVKKLKEFFQNLINLACGSSQPPDIGRTVKELVHDVMQNKISEEEFVEKLQRTLKSDPQPNLVPFLKRTLPNLRESINQQQKLHQQQQQPQHPQARAQFKGNQLQVTGKVPTNSTIKTQIKLQPNKQLVNQPVQMPPYVSSQPGSTVQSAQQIVIPKGLTPEQQQVLTKKLSQGGKVVFATVPQTLGGNKFTGTMTVAPSIAQRVVGGGKTPYQLTAQAAAVAAAADKPKGRSFHYSSTISSADDDINDVTCMAGVNLMEESAKILSTGSDLLSTQTRSCKDETFLSLELLRRRVESVGKKFGVYDIHSEALACISHAAEERLRNLLERLTVCSLHRVEGHKNDNKYEVVSDVKSQLRVFEQIDEVERKHRESREREMLMRVAKSRSRTEDPEQARLKERAKQMQQQEEEINRKRAANKTALEAIGPRKKSKLDEALESLQDSQEPASSSFGSTSLQNNPVRIRTRRITLRDLQFIFEQDRTSSKSRVLFKSFLR